MTSTQAFENMVTATNKKSLLEEKARKAMSMWHHAHHVKKEKVARKKEKVGAAAHAAAAVHDVASEAAAAAADDVDAVNPYSLQGRFMHCCYDFPNEGDDPDLCQLVAGTVVMVCSVWWCWVSVSFLVLSFGPVPPAAGKVLP